MTIPHRQIACAAVLAFISSFAAAGPNAWAQATRTIKIVVPAAPGGVADTAARLFGDQISRAQGITVLIEGRTGAGGVIAAEAVARAAPDGNTILMTLTDLLIPPHVRRQNFDLLTSFEPICKLVSAPTVFVVGSASPYRNLADLLDAARAKPGTLTLASFGPATSTQVAFEMLKRAAKVDMIFLPYPGAAPAISALLGDHVTAAFSTYSTASEQLNAGKLRALATASLTRIESLPEVPTVAETGYKDYELDYWLGILAPARTPRDKVSQLAAWITAALQSPVLKAKLAPLSLYPVGTCGAEFAASLHKQYDDFGRVIRDSNMKTE